jgi:hypothetical protein
MSGWEGFWLAVVTLGSVLAAYWSGQQTMLNRFRDLEHRRRERDLRWREFDED